MEKKEIQEWRDRLIKMFGVYHSDGQEYVTCPLCGINLDELAKHMIEELSKAREEGRKNVKPMQGWVCPKCGSVYSPLTFECSICKGSGIKVKTSDRTSGYDNSSYLN